MELGANSPLIVLPDADIEEVAAVTATTGYANAGQVCISTQRVLVDHAVYGDFIDACAARVRAITTGNPLDESIAMGPLIRESEARRVADWIKEAVEGGASIVVGGDWDGAFHAPTIVA